MKVSFTGTRPRVYLILWSRNRFPAESPDFERVSMGPLEAPPSRRLLHGTGTLCSPLSWCTRVRFWNRLQSLQARCLETNISFSDFKVRHPFHIFALLFSCLMPRSHFRAPFSQSTKLEGTNNIDPYIVWTQRRHWIDYERRYVLRHRIHCSL